MRMSPLEESVPQAALVFGEQPVPFGSLRLKLSVAKIGTEIEHTLNPLI